MSAIMYPSEVGLEISKEKGVYVLFMECRTERKIKVGKFGNLSVSKGIYAYVGSAHGGGGLNSRVSRHLRTAKKCRWHIDYVRRFMKMRTVWLYEGAKEAEHQIADKLMKLSSSIPMKGFGSSDCNCVTHFFKFDKIPESFIEEISVINISR